MPKQASIPTKEDKTIRRSHLSPDALVTQPNLGADHDIQTVYDVFPTLAKRHGDKHAAGYRDVVAVVEEEKEVSKIVEGKEVKEKKTWKYFTLSDYKYLSYNELFRRIEEVGSALQHLGLKEGSRVSVYAETSVNWQIAAHGCTRALLPITTAYPTLGVSGLAHSLTEPEVQAVFTNAALLPTLQSVISKGAKEGANEDKEAGGRNVRFIIYDGECKDQAMLDEFKQVLEERGGQILTFDALRKLGAEHPGNFEKKPSRDDTFCIMYTSGSTGAPKGVVLSHGNIISSLGGTCKLLTPIVKKEDTFLAFLPLSHILEMLVELTFYTMGIRIGYGGVKTLTDASVRNCVGDLKAYKPSIIVGVPAIFETIRKGIVSKINAASPVARGVFNLAFSLKKNIPALGGISDAVVFNKVAEATGGRLRIAMNGGSALSKPTQEFLSTALMTVLQGYGLTETCGMASILVPEFWNYQTVGVPVPSVEIKLQDYPDAGYFNSNKPHPQGEVLLRGGSVFKNYFKRPDLDAESFTEDGWFKTGDIGQWNADGTLSLIDRIKNLIKLSSGEYIALESLESVYKGANVLNNLCVYANSDCNRPLAIATTHEANLRHFLKGQANISDADSRPLEQLTTDPKVLKEVLKHVNEVGKRNGLKGPETLSGILLDAEEWTPENGLVTAAQKLNRHAIIKKHKKEIDELIKKNSS